MVDTSAVAAILFEEADATFYERAIADSIKSVISAASYAECGIVLLRRKGIEFVPELPALLGELSVAIIPVTMDQAKLAIAAYERFGKGRHPAGLNYGDCFSYALAAARGEPLLAKGDDFVRTDIAMAA